MNTFGPIDWRAYYRYVPPWAGLIDQSPCFRCPRGPECQKSVDPDVNGACWRWIIWFRGMWPVVTGKKRAAQGGRSSKDGTATVIHPYSRG